MNDFNGRVCLITGAGSGIGRALAINLAQQGAAIAALDLTPEPLEKLSVELDGKRIAWAVADVTDRSLLRPAVSQLAQQLGPIDLLIASAGIGRETTALSFRAEDIEEIIRVNLIGVSNSIDTVLPGMLERKRGHLCAISSLASFRGMPRMAGYSASKAGLNALLDSLRVELKEHGINVTTICPGWIRTPMTANLDVPQPGLLEAEEAARRIVTALRRNTPFLAFPGSSARRVRLLQWLPCGISDWLVARILRSLSQKKT